MAQLVNKVGGMELKYCSLTSFPGLCHRPVFDCLQYAKMKREGRGNLDIHCMCTGISAVNQLQLTG